MELITKFLVFDHPLAVAMIFSTVAFAAAAWLSLQGGRRLYPALAGRNHKAAAIASFLWYIALSVFFSIFFFALPFAVLVDLGASNYNLGRLGFEAGNYLLVPLIGFFAAGAVALFVWIKKQAIAAPTGVSLPRALWLGARKTLLIILLVFIAFGIARAPAIEEKQLTQETINRIHSTKLALDDVLGKNLPPDPGPDADKTMQGIDANRNGIRDDVELAIFKEYPNSAKTRAALLQYALALQMEVTQPIVNEGTVDAVADYSDRADMCLADSLVPWKNLQTLRSDAEIEKIDAYINFVKNRQLNTEARKKAQHDFYQGNLKGYDKSDKPKCDLDASLLPN